MFLVSQPDESWEIHAERGDLRATYLGILEKWWAKPERLLDQAKIQNSNTLEKTKNLEGEKMEMVKKFFKDESGATMIEYALIAALISIVAILVITAVGQNVKATFQGVDDAMTTANNPPA